MNHLNALETVREIIGAVADHVVVSYWQNKVRRSGEPEKVIKELRKAVKAANTFWVWSEEITEPCIQGSVRYAQSIHHSMVLLGAPLLVEQAEYSAKLQESLKVINTALKARSKEQDAMRLA